MRKRNFVIATSVLFFAICTLLASKVKFDYHNDREGIFIFKGEDGYLLKVGDDLFPEENQRLLWGMALPEFKRATESGACISKDKPCTHLEWNEDSGRGFIKTYYPNGEKLVINLGRYLDSQGKSVSGLFLGGNLSPSDPDFQQFNKNETGMAYFDGNRYFHIWCNVNEGIVDSSGKLLYPSDWVFHSSKILENSTQDLTITSKHQIMVNNVPVTIVRTLFYQTGDTFVTLVTSLKNIGNTPTLLQYIYGDEPWLGDFGSSTGNIGWLKSGLVTTEMQIDTSKNDFIGMFDTGNPLIGEEKGFTTGKANFIEWSPAGRPDLAYFSNQFGTVARPEQKVPLTSSNSRVLAMQWGPKTLNPGQSLSFTLSVGMADNDPKTGLPVKPDTHLY